MNSKKTGKGRVKVTAAFDGIAYEGSAVKTGLPFYILGIRKDIRAKTGKRPGDAIEVTIRKRI